MVFNSLHLFYLPYVPCVPPFLYFLIWSPKIHLVKSKDQNSPLYVIFYSSCLLPPSQPQNIFLNILFSKNLSLCSILSMTDQVSQKNKRTGKMEYGFDSLVYHTVTLLFFLLQTVFVPEEADFDMFVMRLWVWHRICDETGCDTGFVMWLCVWHRICDVTVGVTQDLWCDCGCDTFCDVTVGVTQDLWCDCGCETGFVKSQIFHLLIVILWASLGPGVT